MTECPHQSKNGLPADFIYPNKPSKCTWKVNGDGSESPHIFRKLTERPKVLSNILEAVGHTPLIRLNRIPQSYGIKCEMYAKVEFFNPGGSVKDRIGYRMVIDAEAKGILKPGCTIIEPTSGNTGIGLAMACAVKGYKCLIVMPEKMSNEKVNALKVLGAKIIRTPTEAGFESPEGLIAVAQRLQKEIPDSVILDQYRNAGNPLAHYDTTAEEIFQALDGKVDMIVLGAGTGGTATGIGRKSKELNPACIVVGADPEGSILSRPESLNDTEVDFYEVEGIGYDFIPTVLDHTVVDKWYKTNDKRALPLARRLHCEEGILSGASSGSSLDIALQAAKNLNPEQRCVVLLPDGIRNYMTKCVSDNWMEARGFKELENINNHWWWNKKVSELQMTLHTINIAQTGSDAIAAMKSNNLDEINVVDDAGKLVGVLTTTQLMNKSVNLNTSLKEKLEKFLVKKYIKVTPNTILGFVSRVVEHEKFVVTIDRDEKPLGILTKLDVLNFIANEK